MADIEIELNPKHPEYDVWRNIIKRGIVITMQVDDDPTAEMVVVSKYGRRIKFNRIPLVLDDSLAEDEIRMLRH